MIKNLIRTAFLIAGAALVTPAAPVLSITPSANNVQVGDTFSLFLNIASVTDLFGWQVDIDFGPAGRLTALTIAEGGFLGGGTSGITGAIDNGTATILALANSLTGFTGASGNGVLAQISFTAAAIGNAIVSISNVQLLDSNLDSIFPDPTVSASVDISASGVIPEPSTFILLGIGLAVGAVLRRRA